MRGEGRGERGEREGTNDKASYCTLIDKALISWQTPCFKESDDELAVTVPALQSTANDMVLRQRVRGGEPREEEEDEHRGWRVRGEG